MDLTHLHFSHPNWLWAGIIIVFTWLYFLFFYHSFQKSNHLEKFIDKHLLPYLLIDNAEKEQSIWKSLILWSLVWGCFTLAIAGPRWEFKDMESYSKDQSLVILLDLSLSMNATDIKPSRLVRAKQKIEDLLNNTQGVKIGLIAFAADPHMISPITADKEAIRHLLPSLETSLVYVQGSRLSSALNMASNMLVSEPGSNKVILVMSDGGFEDSSAIFDAKKLGEKGLIIHTIGMGTVEGAPLEQKRKDGTMVFSKLEKDRLMEISKIGNGFYLEANQDETLILKEMEKKANILADIGKTNRIWEEHFYVFIIPAIPVLLWWFRRGFVIALIFFAFNLNSVEEYFKNSEQLGEQAFNNGDFEKAKNCFQDCYRKGVACYRAGDFPEAEKMFRESSREEVDIHANYNLGNALAHQKKFKEAIEAYENVLKKDPTHMRAKENLELLKEMQQQQQENNNDKDNQENSDQKKDSGQNQDEKKDGKQDESDQKNDSSKEQDQQQQSEEQKNEKSPEEIDADQLLNRISNDQSKFLKNKFYIESKKNGTTEDLDPW